MRTSIEGILSSGPKTTWRLNYLGCLCKMQIPLIINKCPEYIKTPKNH